MSSTNRRDSAQQLLSLALFGKQTVALKALVTAVALFEKKAKSSTDSSAMKAVQTMLTLTQQLGGFNHGQHLGGFSHSQFSGDGFSHGQHLGGFGHSGINHGQQLGGQHLAGSQLNGQQLGGQQLGGSQLNGQQLGGFSHSGFNHGQHLAGSQLNGQQLGGQHLAGINHGQQLGGSQPNGQQLGGSHLAGFQLNGQQLGGSHLGGFSHSQFSGGGFSHSGFSHRPQFRAGFKDDQQLSRNLSQNRVANLADAQRLTLLKASVDEAKLLSVLGFFAEPAFQSFFVTMLTLTQTLQQAIANIEAFFKGAPANLWSAITGKLRPKPERNLDAGALSNESSELG